MSERRPSERVSPEAMSIATLQELLRAVNTMNREVGQRLSSIESLTKEQESKGEIYPETVTVTDEVKEINPGVGKWKVASIYNNGPDSCSVQINKKSLLLTMPITVGQRVSKDFEFTTNVIEKVFAKCASGETASLEIEFKR